MTADAIRLGVTRLVREPRQWSPPRVLPAGMRLVVEGLDGGGKWQCDDGLTVIASVSEEQDGLWWLHLSCARPDRLPSWEDLVHVKEMFIGREATALQVIPPRSRHVNIHPHCLHLFHCLHGDVTPDFTRGSGSL